MMPNDFTEVTMNLHYDIMLLSLRYLKSTIGNIRLISKFSKKPGSEDEGYSSAEEEIFEFWLDYFVEAINGDIGDAIRFPVWPVSSSPFWHSSFILFSSNRLVIVVSDIDLGAKQGLHAKLCKCEYGSWGEKSPNLESMFGEDEREMSPSSWLSVFGWHDSRCQVRKDKGTDW